MTSINPISRPRQLTPVKGTAPACEGEQHVLGTHGHDRGAARFAVVTHCRDCGFHDERLLCEGRVRDMVSQPLVKCSGCRSNWQLDELLTIRQLEELPPAPTLALIPGDVLAAFQLHQRAAYGETTVRNRLGTVRALEGFASVPALAITHDAILEYLGRPGVKKSTRRANQAALQAFYRFAQAGGFRSDDPTEGLPKISVPKGQPRPFTRAQVDRMLTSGAYAKTRAMILLGFYQGFRVSQIAAVRAEDISLLDMTIRTIGKGSKERVLPLHEVVAALAALMPQSSYWFPARGGRSGHVNGASVTGLITNAKRRAGIEDPTLTPHSLRHSFGTELVEEGVDIRVIRELMMQESLSSTEIYTGVSPRKRRAGIDALPSVEVPKHSGRSR